MCRLIALAAVALSLGGCWYYDRPLLDAYSRAEVDAINAVAECKALARNLVQVARCDNRR
jgi:hypothetical protein